MFEDRKEAGIKLAKKLIKFNFDNPIILAIPRGGVIVGSELAKGLKIPLNIILVRKLGYPKEPEFGFGAISENNSTYFSERILSDYKLSDEDIYEVKSKEKKELERRIKIYRKGKLLPNLKNRIVILVDDGLATGVSAIVAIMSIKKEKPKELIFATPVAASTTADEISKSVDEFVCLIQDSGFRAIGNYYKNFNQVSDTEVLDLLNN